MSRPKLQPHIGAVAANEEGVLGIITSTGPCLVHLVDGSIAERWVGIRVHPREVPQSWHAAAPHVVATSVADLIHAHHKALINNNKLRTSISQLEKRDVTIHGNLPVRRNSSLGMPSLPRVAAPPKEMNMRELLSHVGTVPEEG